MKLVLSSLVTFLLMTPSAFATSLYHGPFLTKTIGTRMCYVRMGSVTIMRNGKQESVKPVKLNFAELEKAIRGAAKSKLRRVAVHVRATDPAVEIKAGLYPEVIAYPLYRDGAEIEARSGQDAKDLIDQVNSLCAGL